MVLKMGDRYALHGNAISRRSSVWPGKERSGLGKIC
jgi:hypothetical protein